MLTSHARLVLTDCTDQTHIDGLDAEGGFDLVEDYTRVGRLQSCDVSIRAEIGGRNTFCIRRDSDGWLWRTLNEWAGALVAGVESRYPSAAIRLKNGDSIVIWRAHTTDAVCSFRFEVRDV